jgi:hypothetical protein
MALMFWSLRKAAGVSSMASGAAAASSHSFA